MQSAVVGVHIAVNISAISSAYAGVAGLDASVTSAIAVDSVIAVDSAVGDVTVVVGFLWSEILL